MVRFIFSLRSLLYVSILTEAAETERASFLFNIPEVLRKLIVEEEKSSVTSQLFFHINKPECDITCQGSSPSSDSHRFMYHWRFREPGSEEVEFERVHQLS